MSSRLSLLTANPFAATPRELYKSRVATLAKCFTGTMCFMLALPVLAIIAYIFVQAWPKLSLHYLWDLPFNGGKQGGIWPALIGTFYLVLTSLLIVAPIGILSAIYLNEYARENWFNRLITMTVTTLAGVPSIVHGLFGLGAFVLFLGMGLSVLAASCTLAVMTLPVIITATREALGAVPMAFREACWNLGASRWQTIRTLVLPNSISGILTGIILEVARAAGETAPILLTGATFSCPVPESGVGRVFPYGIGDHFQALSFHLHYICNQISNMPDEMKYACAAVLIGLVLVLNSLSISVRVYLRRRKRW
jgi:phosphate transport system permease protein